MGLLAAPVNVLPALGKIMERIVYDQIQTYFDALNIDYQNAYRAANSACTALIQMIGVGSWKKKQWGCCIIRF